MNKYFKTSLNSLKSKNIEDLLDFELMYEALLKEYTPERVGDIVLVQHLAVLYTRIGRSWSAEMNLLNKLRNTSEIEFYEDCPIEDYGAEKLELILTRYEPALLKSILKTRELLEKQRVKKNLVKNFKNA